MRDWEADKRLCQEATPGPWTLETVKTSCGSCHKIGPFPSKGLQDVTHACVYADGEHWLQERLTTIGEELLANARFIAEAREGWPAALEEIKRLRRLLAGLAEAYRVACILEPPDVETDHGYPLDPRYVAARDEVRNDRRALGET